MNTHKMNPMVFGTRLAQIAAVIGFLAPASAAQAQVVIDEVLYRSTGVDVHVFVELYGTPGTDLSTYTLVGVNGANGADYNAIALSGTIPADGIFVIAHPDANAAIAAEADMFAAAVDFQNGPDNIVLRNDGVLVDAIGYGTFTIDTTFAGEGAAAPGTADDQSLTRDAAHSDTGNNAADFVVASTPTPGAASGGGGAVDSCDGVCGATAPSGNCFCDAVCFGNGDCCADICTYCAADFPGGCGAPECTDDADCPSGEICYGAICVPYSIPGWTCVVDYYGSNDGCDCGCGIVDPDCGGSEVGVCQYCADAGSCTALTDCSEINPTDNSSCLSEGCTADADCGTDEVCDLSTGICIDISAWTCNLAFFAANDGCDCGCGIVDPDCPNVSAAACQFCYITGGCGTAGVACPSNIEPTNNAVCVAGVCTDDSDCGAGEVCDIPSGQCIVEIAGTCAGQCGTEGTGNCFCDEACFVNGDCCPDVCAECAADFPQECGVTPDCTVDAECGYGMVCLGGTCVPGTGAGYTVSIDSLDSSGFPVIEAIVSVTDDATGDDVAGLGLSNFTISEDGELMENCTVTSISEGSTAAKADIVFVFDVTGSMGEEVEDLKTNILAFSQDLEVSNIDYNLGLVIYGDYVEGIYGMTRDASEFRSYVQSITLGAGSAENPLDAIVEALNLNMRADSERIFILATDEEYTVWYTTLNQAIQAAQAADVTVHAATLPSLNTIYEPLVLGTGGVFFDILTNSFAEVLEDLSAELINRYQVICTTPTPARNNTWRHVTVQVNDGASGGEGTGDYFIQGGSLIVDPTYTVAQIGNSFFVDLVAASVTDLQNAHLVLTFDPSYLELVGATAGELLGRDDSNGTVQPPLMLFDPGHDPANGRIAIAIARQSPEGTDGTGVVATLELALTAPTPDDLDANNNEDTAQADDLVFVLGAGGIFLEDSANREIVVVSVQNGDIDSEQGFLLGDFDEDGDIDIIDFNTLVTNWGSTTATLTGSTGGDIGPATGLPPNMVPSPDGIVNFHDLFVFTRMFNWYRFEQ